MIRLRSKDTATKESTTLLLNGTNSNNNNANRNNNNNHYSNKQNLYKRNVILSKLVSIIVSCISLPIVILCIVLVVIILLLFALSNQLYNNNTSNTSIAYNQQHSQIQFCLNSNNNIYDSIVHNDDDDDNDNDDQSYYTNTTHLLSSSSSSTLLFSIDDYCSKYNQKEAQQIQQRQNVQLQTKIKKDDPSTSTNQSKQQQQSQQEQVEDDNELPSILIIGGTDGSGTRAIVNVLRDYLGTNIIYEDPITLDIHAPILFHRTGWPSLVNYILNYTHSGNYEYNTLPQSMKDLLQYELYKFHQYYTKYAMTEIYKRKQYQKTMKTISDTNKSNTNRNRTLSNINSTSSTTIPSPTFTKSKISIKNSQFFHHFGGNLPPRRYSTSTTSSSNTRRKWKQPSNYKSNAIHVLYGFKAPITMMLLPIFVELYSTNTSILYNTKNQYYPSIQHQQQQQQQMQYNSKIKFIHVVRDGRDVSLGANKSPVTKFYNTYYGQSIAQQRRTELYLKYNNATTVVSHFYNSTTGSNTSNDTFVNTVLAIDLWNDWNMQAYTYAMSHKDTVDYIVIRTEDIVSTNISIKYSTITKLAHFVGTNQLTNNDICQYSQDTNQTKDLGVSSATYGTSSQKRIGGSQASSSTGTNPFTAYWRRKPINGKTIINNKRILESNSSSSISTYNLSDHQDQSFIEMNELKSLRKREVLEYAKQIQSENEIDVTSQSVNDTSTGSSTTTNNTTTNVSAVEIIPIHQRYGKWKLLLQNQSMLSLLLHTRGQEALVLFGYEPYRIIDSDLYYSDADTICSNIKT